jgi:hypothetical protein
METGHQALQIQFGCKDQKDEKQLKGLKSFFSVKQIHSANWVEILKDSSKDEVGKTEADALVLFRDSFMARQDKEIHLAVQTADCVPILIAAFEGQQNPGEGLGEIKAIAAVHSGWRGTVQKLPSLVIQDLKKSLQKKDLSASIKFNAWIGPSIHQKDYQVDEPVYNKFKEAGLEDALIEDKNTVSSSKDKRWLLSVSQAVKEMILKEGLQEEDLFQDQRNTFDDPELASYRRNEKGRQWSVITWSKK